MRIRTSASIFGLPNRFTRDRRRQNSRKPARCQATTVCGLTMTRTLSHAGQSRRRNIQNSRSWMRSRGRGLLSLQYAELLAKGQDLKANAVAGTEEGAEAGEERCEKWNHGFGFIAYGSIPAPALSP